MMQDPKIPRYQEQPSQYGWTGQAPALGMDTYLGVVVPLKRSYSPWWVRLDLKIMLAELYYNNKNRRLRQTSHICCAQVSEPQYIIILFSDPATRARKLFVTSLPLCAVTSGHRPLINGNDIAMSWSRGRISNGYCSDTGEKGKHSHAVRGP